MRVSAAADWSDEIKSLALSVFASVSRAFLTLGRLRPESSISNKQLLSRGEVRDLSPGEELQPLNPVWEKAQRARAGLLWIRPGLKLLQRRNESLFSSRRQSQQLICTHPPELRLNPTALSTNNSSRLRQTWFGRAHPSCSGFGWSTWHRWRRVSAQWNCRLSFQTRC